MSSGISGVIRGQLLKVVQSRKSDILEELQAWQHAMQSKPSLFDRATKGVQSTINEIIPEKIHQVVTKAIKEVTRGVLFGAGFTTFRKRKVKSVYTTEKKIRERINFYSSSAAVEGAATGFGGFLLGLADFPLWLTLKMKMLFDIASHYGMDVKELSERVFILHIFQITFSSQKHRNEIYPLMANWDKEKSKLPEDIRDFDWRTFQLEYRDHIDLAKLLQLIPGVGAVVGAYVNHKLTNKLGKAAMNAYRMRLLREKPDLLND